MNTEPVVINTVPEKTQTQLDRFKAVVGGVPPTVVNYVPPTKEEKKVPSTVVGENVTPPVKEENVTPPVKEENVTPPVKEEKEPPKPVVYNTYWFYKKTGTEIPAGMIKFPLDAIPIPSMIKLDSGKFEENAKALVKIVGETGFCTVTSRPKSSSSSSETVTNNLNPNIVSGLTSKSTVNSFIVVFNTAGAYAGICIIKMRYEESGEPGLNFYIDYLCSIVPGAGTVIIRMIQDAIENVCEQRCQDPKARWRCTEPCIFLHVMHDTAIGFYLKRGFQVSSFFWRPGDSKDVPLETYFKPKGGKRTTRRKRRKSRKLIKMDF